MAKVQVGKITAYTITFNFSGQRFTVDPAWYDCTSFVVLEVIAIDSDGTAHKIENYTKSGNTINLGASYDFCYLTVNLY